MRAASTWSLLALLVATQAIGSRAAFADRVVLDDFAELAGWTAISSEGTHVWIARESDELGTGMRIGFDLNAGGGYVIVRKSFSLTLPENYAFSFRVRGEARPNNLEFKLVDSRGKNVWWRNQRDFVFPREWQRVTIRKSRLDFAWGLAGGGEPKQVGAIEFAISAGQGGSGSVWIGDLGLEAREPAGQDNAAPEAQASTSLPGHEPPLFLDQDGATTWKSAPLPREQWAMIDFGKNREYGGLVIDWDADDYAVAFEVQVSSDGSTWTTAYRTATGHGGRDYIYMPDAESRFIRLALQRSSRSRGYGIVSLVVKPFEFSASANQFFGAIAKDAPPGTYPKYLYGKQTYWTVIGVEGDDKSAILNEEGMLEVEKGGFSIEPFLYTDGGLITWSSARTEQTLEDGYLPIPSVTWRQDRLGLRVTAFANGEAGRSTLIARYRVENHGDHGEPVQLFLAIRPFQVNPPWQSLNMNGGVTHIQEMRFDGRTVWVNRDKGVVSLMTPDHFGAGTFEEGFVTQFLVRGKVPSQTDVSDPFGFASGALQYNFYLEPRAHAEVDLAVPFHDAHVAVAGLGADGNPSWVAERQEETRRRWQNVLGRVEISLPPSAEKIARTLKTELAYILINRDGPAIRPGSRNYARAWIRDGALTSVALLQLGTVEEVREFLEWFARYQAADGKVPCCIDGRGADPVVENDSAGALIFGIAEYYRFTHDVGFLADLWPRVVRAVEYMATLRKRRMTEEFKAPDKQALYGLLPESISHEGYAAHPVHSYWDDFFALRGFKDAAELAVVVGDDEHATKFAALRDAFREALYTSIGRSVADHGIDYIPGSVELGDFDPTSTSIAVVPGGELANLPEPALTRTFDRYWEEFEKRKGGATDWDAYTPYEIRNVGTFVRLGQRDRALALLDWFLADRRPVGWNEWAEIAWRDPTAPRFIGDMPHTWVGAGYIRSVRSLFAYERESDDALVLAAGVPAAWVRDDPGVTVKRLPTHYGVLNYTLRADGADAVRLRLSGDLAVPPGKIVVSSPLPRPLRSVKVNGKPVDTFTADAAVVGECPADVVLGYEPGST